MNEQQDLQATPLPTKEEVFKAVTDGLHSMAQNPFLYTEVEWDQVMGYVLSAYKNAAKRHAANADHWEIEARYMKTELDILRTSLNGKNA